MAKAPNAAASQTVKIVLGGIAGLVMGYCLIYAITGNDLFGWLPSRDQPVVPPPVAHVPPVSQPPARPVPERPPPSFEPPQIETEPQSVAAAAPATEAKPAPPVESNPAPVAAPARAPPPAAPPAAPRKHPQPSAEERQRMLAEVQSLYKSEFEAGQRAEGRAAFVAFLMEAARKLPSDRGAQFVLYREAYDRALALADFATMADAIDELERDFEVDGYRLRLHLLSAAAEGAKGGDDCRPLIEFALDMADFAEATERIEDLPKLASVLDSLARPIADKDLKAQATARAAELLKAAESYGPILAARRTLAANPADAAASVIDGRYRCFTLGDWAAGLPLLAQSDHAALAAAARQDLAGPSATTPAVAIGDSWFDIGSVDPGLRAALARAEHWYRQALSEIDGLTRVKVEKRLAQIATVNLPPRLSQPAGADAPLPSARFLLTRSKAFEATDLLTAITPHTPRTPGWEILPGMIRVDSQAHLARLESPLKPGSEYQMAVRLTRTSSPSAGSMFVIGLPHARSQALAVIDYPVTGDRYASFLTLASARRLEDNPTLRLTEGTTPLLARGQEQVLVCIVKPSEIVIRLGGQPLIAYRGDMSKLSVQKEWAVQGPRSLFLGAHQAGFTIRGWALAPLRDAAGQEVMINDPSEVSGRKRGKRE